MEIIFDSEKNNSIISGNIYGLYKCDLKSFLSDFNLNSEITYIDLMKCRFKTSTVKDEMKYYLNKFKKNDSLQRIKIKDLNSIFCYEDNFFDKKVSELSQSEKYLFFIMVNCLSINSIIVFDNIFYTFDKKTRKSIFELFSYLKRLDKIVFICDDDINILFSNTDYVIYFDKGNIIYQASIKKINNQLDEIISKKLTLPDILSLEYIAKTEKNIKLSYYTDVRDVIKDIYKHV